MVIKSNRSRVHIFRNENELDFKSCPAKYCTTLAVVSQDKIEGMVSGCGVGVDYDHIKTVYCSTLFP